MEVMMGGRGGVSTGGGSHKGQVPQWWPRYCLFLLWAIAQESQAHFEGCRARNSKWRSSVCVHAYVRTDFLKHTHLLKVEYLLFYCKNTTLNKAPPSPPTSSLKVSVHPGAMSLFQNVSEYQMKTFQLKRRTPRNYHQPNKSVEKMICGTLLGQRSPIHRANSTLKSGRCITAQMFSFFFSFLQLLNLKRRNLSGHQN